jgi:hypothetical protein
VAAAAADEMCALHRGALHRGALQRCALQRCALHYVLHVLLRRAVCSIRCGEVHPTCCTLLYIASQHVVFSAAGNSHAVYGMLHGSCMLSKEA